ncbi:MAG: hypothetical protein J3K34DRAFT_444002 [Monoraphidium minutum]|nr:MAG: hypothetical protein J3K34DRAFT_448883 [Monoraphidium minutum]KAI8463060.1 MAG: hypothetical protein J3K34DRAFT_445412 [Monoraphidium minutum]KAI8463458.1 MAG: hypothetical protein J3K34DRAFT_444002 [Monoraphidium minutum]
MAVDLRGAQLLDLPCGVPAGGSVAYYLDLTALARLPAAERARAARDALRLMGARDCAPCVGAGADLGRLSRVLLIPRKPTALAPLAAMAEGSGLAVTLSGGRPLTVPLLRRTDPAAGPLPRRRHRAAAAGGGVAGGGGGGGVPRRDADG